MTKIQISIDTSDEREIAYTLRRLAEAIEKGERPVLVQQHHAYVVAARMGWAAG